MAKGSFVSYLRVSTQKQGQSGLGLEAQRKAVEDYLNGGDWNVIEELVEIESGKNNRRPKLNEAIDLCKASGATLVVAKARGVQLGAYRGDKFVGRTGTAEDAKKASEARTALYRRRTADRLPMLQKIDPDCSLSLRSIAERLNQMNVPTISGKGSWSANSVRRLKAVS